MIYTRGVADVYNLRHVAEVEFVIALDEHDTLGAGCEDGGELGEKIAFGDVVLIDLVAGLAAAGPRGDLDDDRAVVRLVLVAGALEAEAPARRDPWE